MIKKLSMILCLFLACFSLTSCDIEAILNEFLGSIEDTEDDIVDVEKVPLTDGEVEFHFLELGNEYAGDSIYVRVGSGESQIDILIDAGSRANSAKTIKEYVDNYCTDGKLEYVISSHAHQDHIAGFVGNSSGSTRTGILYQYEIGTIIDFPLTNATSTVYRNYLTAVEYAVSNGATHYTASECFNETNGAKAVFDLAENINFRILYNEYYETKSSDENNYSVVTLFNCGEDSVLLTGDLELEGEEALAEYYTKNKGILGHCSLFKAGHHGSKTSSNDCLLDLITPSISVVCCVAGSTEYTENRENTFPTQAYIDRIAKHTSQVYVTSMYDEETDDVASLNGNVVIKYSSEGVNVNCSNNNTLLKDSAWFSHLVNVDKDDKIVETPTASTSQVPCRTLPENWR